MLRSSCARLVGPRVVLAALLSTACAAPLGTPLGGLRPGYVASNTAMPPAGAFTVQGQSAYLSYHAGTLADALDYRFVRHVRAEVCQRGIAIPFATVTSLITGNNINAALSADVRWGDGSLNEAVRAAMADAAPDEALVDVALDIKNVAVLSVIYRQTCLVLQGKVMAPLVRGLNTVPLVPMSEPMPPVTMPASVGPL